MFFSVKHKKKVLIGRFEPFSKSWEINFYSSTHWVGVVGCSPFYVTQKTYWPITHTHFLSLDINHDIFLRRVKQHNWFSQSEQYVRFVAPTTRLNVSRIFQYVSFSQTENSGWVMRISHLRIAYYI